MTEKSLPLDSQSRTDESNDLEKSLASLSIKCKNYRVKNNEWHCRTCSIYCNSTLQFEMHLVSQKHKIIDLEQKARRESSPSKTEASHESTNSKDEFNSSKECGVSVKEECVTPSPDENNNSNFQAHSLSAVMNPSQRSSNVRIKSSYSPIEISQNLIAIKFNVNAEKYLIPENKKNGKFEKFGFYCSLCNAYMTGQIQLIMHVKGARHQYFSPNEIPGYKSSKLFNPNQYLGSHKHKSERQSTQQSKLRQQSSGKTPSIVNHVNEIKINNFTSNISPTLQHSVPNGGGTYYDYLVRNEALMYGSQNHNHSHQHHHHHHHQQQRGMFNSISSLNQITPNLPGVNGNYQVNGQNSNIDFFNQHHHSNIYMTPTLLRQQQQHPSKYLQLPTLLQYTTPQHQLLAPQLTQNYGTFINEQSSQAQMSFIHQQTPPPPPPSSVSSSATSQDNLTLGNGLHVTTTPVSSYQSVQNNVPEQYSKEITQCNANVMSSRLKSRYNNSNVNAVSSAFKDVTNTKREDMGYYFNQSHQFQHQTPQYTSSGISIITTKPSGMHQVHHHVLPQPHHQSHCNFYFNAQIPSSNGETNNLNEFSINQATTY